MLDERKIRVLFAIINSYIDSGDPIGSRTISKTSDLGVSSATIRNEMSDLEDLGFLNKPHSSAGRVPSDKAYRLYVDELLKKNPITTDIIRGLKIKDMLMNESWEIDDLIQNSAKILSALTSYTSVVASPKMKSSRVKQIQLVSLDDLGVLIIIVCDTGIVKNSIFKPGKPIGNDRLNIISNFLNAKLKGMTIEDLVVQLESDVFEELYEYKSIVENLIPIINNSIEDLVTIDLYSEGLTKILNYPEFKDIEKAKSFISFVEDKNLILDILLDNPNQGVDIIIGSENLYAPIKDISIITASYTLGGKLIGKIGLIGPTRMDYLNLIDTVNVFSKHISDNLEKLFGNK